jgi:hypothetical protein
MYRPKEYGHLQGMDVLKILDSFLLLGIYGFKVNVYRLDISTHCTSLQR